MKGKAMWLCAVCAGTVEKMLPLRVEVGTMRKAQCQQCGKRKMVMRYVVEENRK